MTWRSLIPFVLWLAAPACSQENKRDYDIMGTMNVQIDGAAHELCVPNFPEEDNGASAKLTGPVASMQSLLISAFTCNDGDLDDPSLDLTVFRPGPSATGSDLNLSSADGTTYVAGEEKALGALKVSDVEISNGHVTLAFEATGIAVELDGFDYIPVDGVGPVEISGTADVQLEQ